MEEFTLSQAIVLYEELKAHLLAGNETIRQLHAVGLSQLVKDKKQSLKDTDARLSRLYQAIRGFEKTDLSISELESIYLEVKN